MDVELAVKGLAVLTAIPIVLLALWADYFSRRLAELIKTNPSFDRTAELYKMRIAGLCAIFFQFGIFMGTGAIRQEAPLPANLFFVGAILAQAIIQSRIEKILQKMDQKMDAKPAQDIEMAIRAFVWATMAGALYIAALMVPVFLASAFTQLLHVSAPASFLLTAVSAIIGMLGGLTLNFALGTFYLRKTLPSRAIEEAGQLSLLNECFIRAGLNPPSFWVIENGRTREGLAMLTGFQAGRGLFRPGLFISRSMLDSLNEEELRATVLHEASHLKLQHLKKRLLLSIGLILATTMAAIFCIFVANVLVPNVDSRNFIGFAAAAAAFVLTFKTLSLQNRSHEIAADRYCVEKLGANPSDFSSALRKLDAINGHGAFRKNPFSTLTGLGHPATERRIAILTAYLNVKAVAPVEQNTREDRAA